ncbi:MAG: TetR/AcrR family transcriptional regulator [Williamsia herbipolensis]|nr:TetR/AcrR family transcriptional regulator [Williamsia herbipolensis]
MTRDWLVDDDRADRARERLLGEAAAMIRQNGVDRFDINELARRAHCSRATVYRHVGGKDAIIEAVLTISSATVTTAVAERIAGLSGRERGVVAIAAALREIRADTLTRQLLTSRRLQSAVPAAVASPTIIGIAIELMGLESEDVVSAQWVIRGFLALALWPMAPDHEATAVRALVAGVIGEG